MPIEIHVDVPKTVVAAAERALKRAGVRDSKDRRKLRALLHKWAQAGMLKVAGQANVLEQRAAAVDRINERDVDALLARARQDPAFRKAEAAFVAYRDRDKSRAICAREAAHNVLCRIASGLDRTAPLLELTLQRMIDEGRASTDEAGDHVLEEGRA